MAKHVVCLTISFLFVVSAYADEHKRQRPLLKGWTGPLDQLGFDGSLERLPEPRNWEVKQVSSYDRTGGNRDDRGGHQIYDGGVIIADMRGPGVVTRIWTREPHGTAYIFVDDVEHPLISLPFRDLFSGAVEFWSPGFNLFAPPFTGQGAGGYFSYVPIPFEKRFRMVIKTDEDRLAYQVTYAQFPKETPIDSFQLALSKDDTDFFRHWAKRWEGVDLRRPKRKESMHHSRHNFRPGKNAVLFPIEGEGVLTEIELITESQDSDITDGTWIAIYFDGQKEPGVLAPIGDFFGASTKDSADHNSLVIGQSGSRMWCRYPMPFRNGVEIRLITTSQQIADIEYFITWQPGPVEDANYFFARYNSGVTQEGIPYRVADIGGEGHYVGTTIAAANADSLTFLEGDDTYAIDGASGEDFHGTGTDDYFNAGWYFAEGTMSSPTHTTTLKSTDSPSGFSAFRSHITEPVPFKSSFVFDLEHGPGNNRPGINYSSVAYWYQKDATANTWPIAELEGVQVVRP